MLKGLGAFLLLFCGAGGGVALRAYFARQCRQCEAFLALLRTARAQIETFAASPDKILARCAEKTLADCGWPAGPRPRDFAELLRGCRLVLPQEPRAVIADFATRFGGNTPAEEARACAYYAERLAPLARDLRQGFSRRARAALCLPPLAAAMLVLLLF